jgi:hypothetical protein
MHVVQCLSWPDCKTHLKNLVSKNPINVPTPIVTISFGGVSATAIDADAGAGGGPSKKQKITSWSF